METSGGALKDEQVEYRDECRIIERTWKQVDVDNVHDVIVTRFLAF